MTYLVDTHVLLWWWSESTKLASRVKSSIIEQENRILVGAASMWEISTKTRLGKLPSGEAILREWNERIVQDRFQELPITAAHARLAGSFTHEHRDPFDRMLAAQGLIEKIPILSRDQSISDLGASRIWD